MNTLKHREDGRAGDQQSDRMKTGWSTKCLGDLCEIELGKTPARANALYWDEKRETGNVWLSIADLLRAEGNVVVDSKEYVSDKAAAICKLVPKGTLLVSFKLTLGRLAFAGRDLFTNEAIAALTIYNERELSKEFLYYALTFFDWVKAAENDVKLKGMTLNKAKLKVLPVSFPPLAEQQRIVAILDEAFEGIATARKHTEQNLQNAKALFESHLEAVFSQKGDGWVETKLADICEVKDGTHDSPRYVETGIPFITQKNIRTNGLSFDNTKFICQEDHTKFYKRSNVSDGDILISMIGANRGMACIVQDTRTFSIKNVGLVKRSKSVEHPYLLYYFKTEKAKSYIDDASKGGAQEFIGLSELRNFPIILVPLIQQRSIAAELDALRDETNRLCDIYTQKIAALDALKKSLLHQAFSGEL